jgi:hypothetical protein
VDTTGRARTQVRRLKIMVSPVRIRVPPLTKVLHMRCTGSGSVTAETVTPPDSPATSIYINLHHLYITQRAVLGNSVQVRERESA